MFDGRQIQFWCEDSPTEGMPLAYPIWPAGYDHFPEGWEQTCSTHEDCRMRNGKTNQHCTDFTWVATDDKASYSTGTSCYTWDYNRCTEEIEATAASNVTSLPYGMCPAEFPICYSDGDCTTDECAAGNCTWNPNVNYKTGSATDGSYVRCEQSHDAAMAGGQGGDGEVYGQTFAISNTNYGTTKFSFYTQMWCKNRDYGFVDQAYDDFGGQPEAEWVGDREDRWEGEDEERWDEYEGREGGGDNYVDAKMGDASLLMEETDGGLRVELRMGATKLAAAAATAILATSLQ